MDNRKNGRKNPIVISQWPEEQILTYLKENVKTKAIKRVSNQEEDYPFDDCHLWTESFQNGYPAISQGHAKSKIKVHIMIAYEKFRKFPMHNQVVSHLCHRKACINPNHIIIEPIVANNRRLGCICTIKVPTSIFVVGACIHEPVCLRRDTDNIPKHFKPILLN